jgi:predicted transcriptional regulator
MKKEKEPYHVLLKRAMDGRKNRWLSEKSGIHESEICRIVKGSVNPSTKQLEKIAAVFPSFNLPKE